MFRKIQPDKWKHFFVGIPMGAVLQIASNRVLTNFTTAVIVALVIVIAISYGFELFSKITGMGHYDFWDAVASVIGGVLGIGLVLILQHAIFPIFATFFPDTEIIKSVGRFSFVALIKNIPAINFH